MLVSFRLIRCLRGGSIAMAASVIRICTVYKSVGYPAVTVYYRFWFIMGSFWEGAMLHKVHGLTARLHLIQIILYSATSVN